MINFNEILKSTLSAINKAFKDAQKDLEIVASQISSAVKENAGDDFDFVMREIRSDVDGLLYRFYFDTDVKNEFADAINITYIHIPSGGYPVSHGVYSFKDKIYGVSGYLNNKEELNKYFADFLQTPESPLIQAIGYVMRKNKNDD